MHEITFEQVLSEIQLLPPEAQAKLRDMLNAAEVSQPSETVSAINGVTNRKAESQDSAQELARAASLRDYTADRQWLKDHCDEFAGQWVALKNGQLISHGSDHMAVYREAKTAGHPDALFELVEPSDAPPFFF